MIVPAQPTTASAQILIHTRTRAFLIRQQISRLSLEPALRNTVLDGLPGCTRRDVLPPARDVRVLGVNGEIRACLGELVCARHISERLSQRDGKLTVGGKVE